MILFLQDTFEFFHEFDRDQLIWLLIRGPPLHYGNHKCFKIPAIHILEYRIYGMQNISKSL